MWVGRASQVTANAGHIELEDALVFGALQAVRPQAGGLGVVFHQRYLLVFSTGQLQIFQGVVVDKEHAGSGAIFRRHVGNGGAVAHGQAVGAFAEEFQVGANNTLAAQEFRDCQYQVGTVDARAQFAGEFHTDDVGQTHHGRVAQHHVLGFQAAHAYGDHAERIHHGGVAVGADTGIRVGHAVTNLYHWRHLFQIDLVHDAVTRRDHVHVIKGGLGPVDKVETVFVAALFHRPVFLEGVLFEARVFNCQRVIHDQLGGHHRVDLGRVTALLGDGVAQAGQIHQCSLAKDVVADHPGRIPGEIQVAFALDQLLERIGQRLRRAAAYQLLGKNT